MSKRCCVPGCGVSRGNDTNPVLHRFPDPAEDVNRFLTWVTAIGGEIVGLNNEYIFKNRKVCRTHFEGKYLCRNDRLSNIAIPRLNLLGISTRHSNMMEYSLRRPLQSIENLQPVAFTSQQAIASTSQQAIASTSQRAIASTSQQAAETSQEAVAFHQREATSKRKLMHPETTVTSTSKEVPTPSKKRRRNTDDGSKQQHKARWRTKRNKVTHSEHILYQKLAVLKNKLLKSQKQRKEYMMKLKKSTKTIMNNPNFIKMTESLTSSAKILTLLQFREGKKKDKGRRFQTDEKLIALTMLKQSPKAYRFLRKIFVLPSPQVLNKMLNKTNLKPGMNQHIFEQLRHRVANMKEKDKLCVLMYDEISLQANITYNERKDRITGFVDDGNEVYSEFADHCLVFMVRGLIKRFKQPLSYTFCKGATKGIKLAVLIKEILRKLMDVGLIPVATVCDQGANNRSAINYLIDETKREATKKGESHKDNIFKIDDAEVIPLFDPPHLIKGIRNNLLSKDLKYAMDGKMAIAKWEHIELLFKEDPGYKGMRLIKSLTEKHVNPRKIGKMKVKYATQVFSATVSANMGYLADKGILPVQCKETADLLRFFDNLFDSLNGSFSKRGKHGKPLLKPVTPNSPHHKQWQDAKKILLTMKFMNKSGKQESVPSIKNWLWTLEGCELLTKKVMQYGVNSLYMRHLNQDPIENFFGQIRSHGCRNTNPTAANFESAFATLLITAITGTHSPGANCQDDNCHLLYQLVTECEAKTEPCHEINCDHLFIQFTPLEEKKKNVKNISTLKYVAGWVAKTAKKKIFHGCRHCNSKIINSSEHDEYIATREYKQGQRWLYTPSDDLLILYSNFQDIIYEILKVDLHKQQLMNYIKTIILLNCDLNDIFNCGCHKNALQKFVVRLICRFYVYNHCKNINRVIKGIRDIDDPENKFQIMARTIFEKSIKKK